MFAILLLLLSLSFSLSCALEIITYVFPLLFGSFPVSTATAILQKDDGYVKWINIHLYILISYVLYTQVNMVEFGARHFSHEMNKRKGKENIHARALACYMKLLLRSFGLFIYVFGLRNASFVASWLNDPNREGVLLRGRYDGWISCLWTVAICAYWSRRRQCHLYFFDKIFRTGHFDALVFEITFCVCVCVS